MKKIFSKYKFKGWDWTELASCWGCRCTKDEECEKAIDKYICERLPFGSEKEISKQKECAKDLRRFLKKLVKGPGCSKPIWQGLLQVEDNYTLLSFTRVLLTFMWN